MRPKYQLPRGPREGPVKLLSEHAYKTGTFTLASGVTSNEYLDVKNALHHAGASRQLAYAVVRRLNGEPYVDAIAGVAVGGIPLATLVAHTLTAATHTAHHQLTVRAAPKEHGTGAQIDGLANLRGDVPPQVLLVEDVVTSGGSTISAVKALQEAGLRVVYVITVVDREAGGREAIKAAYPEIPFFAVTTLSAVRAAAGAPK